MATTEQIGKVATSIVDVMKGAPVILALLLVNIGFLAFFSYLMGQVSANARERNKAQLELIESLVKDIRDCRGGGRSMLFKDTIGKAAPYDVQSTR